MGSTIKSFTLLAVVLVAFSQTSARPVVLWDGSASPTSSGYGGPSNSTTLTNWTFNSPPGFTHESPTTGTHSSWDQAVPLSRSEGWMVDVGIDVLSTSQGPWGSYVSAADDDSGVYFFMFPDSFSVLTGGTSHPSVNVGAAGYHTYQLVMPAGGMDVSIHVDGNPTAAATYTTSGTTIAQGIVFGDGASNAGAAEASWDFVNINADTATPPATTFTWNIGDSGNWHDLGNWSKEGLGTVPNARQHTAILGSEIMSPRTVFTDTDVTVNRIEFSNATHSYAVSGHGSVNLFATTDPNSPVNPSIGVQGTHLFQVAVNLHAPTTADVASGSVLTFDGALNLSGTTLHKTGDGMLTINNRVTLGGGSVVNAQGTITGNGTIGGDVNNQGGTISPGDQALSGSLTNVPEPSTMLLLVLGALFGFRVRRGSR